MIKNIIKIGLVSILCNSLYAGEVQYGHGTFEMNGGFIGLTQDITADINTYSMIEQHKNIASSTWYYKYNFTWYDSDDMIQAQDTINSYSNGFLQNPVTKTTPSIDYRLQGLDLNVVLGKDLFHEDENNYFGAGILLGLSIPWIDSKKSDSNNDSTSDNAMNAMKDSKTKMLTYKIGPSITARKSLNKYFTVYGSATYAYQTGSFKNDYAKTDLNVDGIFQEYDFGIRFQPVSIDYEFGWLTISPRLYATLGYRYTSWDLNDIAMDVTGIRTTVNQIDFNMNSSITYVGIGYSF